MPTAHRLSDYTFSPDDVYLLDANVWLLLFPPIPNGASERTKNYSAAYKKIKQVKCRVAIDVLVLSEYINRYIRVIWNAWYKRQYTEFKDFRRSADAKRALEKAASDADLILKECERHDHPFSNADIAQILSEFRSNVRDVNDGLLLDVCRRNNWKIVTDDGDFKNASVDIITNNRKLAA